MAKKSKSPNEGLGKFALWQWGLTCIFGGIVANFVSPLVMSTPANTAAARGQAFGRGLATLLAIIAGIVLIVMHFVRRNRG
jgi:polyferredoxin